MGKKKKKSVGSENQIKAAGAATDKLSIWQQRLADSDNYWSSEREKMDRREALYRGDDTLKPLVPGDTKHDGGAKRTSHVRNIVFENIESQISSAIPQPKVTAKRKKDEHLAQLIEHYLRNELDRLPFEEMNDMAERTTPMHGGVGWQLEWDNAARTHTTVGEVRVRVIHPKQFAPQPGIYTGIGQMDWFIVKVPTTKEAVLRTYGVDVSDEAESEPNVRSTGAEDTAEDAVTMYVGYEVGKDGGINKYVWVGDKTLEDMDNYQARRQPVCTRCGMVRPVQGQTLVMPAAEPNAGVQPTGVYDGGACPWCGCQEFEDREQEYEQIILPITTSTGVQIPGAKATFDENGNAVVQPTLIPYYKPDMYPFVLQRSVSVYGQLLGSSDVDAIADQQNTINRMEQKIIDRLVKAGTRITLPDRADLRTDPEDGERWFVNPQDKACIDVYQFSGDLQYELAYMNQVYEEPRQILGITDSFQGRRDPTATSGVAKQYSAAQAAGRFDSKRVMKNAAYAQLFEMMFKFALAYSDEPRPVSYKDHKGQAQYEEFNRYDFLEYDAAGQLYWNDQFLFSCDNSATLASNREAMWQETRLNLQTGAFGDPTQTATLILFWSKMEQLHYPGASDTKTFLENRQKQEQEQQMMAMQMQLGQGTPLTTPVSAQAATPVAGGAPAVGGQISPVQGG